MGANAPLYAHSSQTQKEFSVDFTIKYYIQNGFKPENVILGMGTYGRSMRLASASSHAMGSAATGGGSAGTVYFMLLLKLYKFFKFKYKVY